MKLFQRIIAVIVVVPATFFFVFWIPFSFLSEVLGDQYFTIVRIVSLVCAVAAGWFIWSKTGTPRPGLISSILKGALLIGSISFLAGFIGPGIFMPENNLGPLLGLLYTGPGGFVLGGIVGFLYWVIRGRKKQQ